ncbi:5-formyltetrahydrofolate cyclo-ligase [Hydrogenimonas thermophila]|uniref:5-formyltetrahydrofolate cyclo-ligase n=1 Tax=Hydrogenimonas thermophila TaxID=223786 RepID=UPI002937014F|nr:5-formyltetrahydrofolate cyclo-ligase [Hydrogenimonas thermophila]WOE68844.1 5-formyltetrahydrofolate cyclo-ligase [Hydrogenimonas thermophila]WOE71352.1 5-formyltetrahydrofolate cyclo-ligase [Hydrogenimonas thermophila]
MDKQTFRELCIRKLRKTAKIGKLYRNKKVLKELEEIIIKSNIKSILLYMPMNHEVDVRPLFKRFRKGIRIYVPFMEGKSFKLVQYRLPLQKKRFGIYEPMNSNFYLSKIDMAVVPVVGVDGKLCRIGFGKGMYDRFFSTLKDKPITVFIQLMKCYTKHNITDEFDIQADIYITPEDTIFRGKHNVNRVNYRRCSSHSKRRCSIFNN